jgi:sortase A
MRTLFYGNKRSPRWRKAHIAEGLLLLAGFVCVGWFVFTVVDAKIYQSYENYRLDATLAGERASVSGYVRQLLFGPREVPGPETPEEGKKAERPRRLPRPATGSMIGRLEIPRIKISSVVREGADDKTLKRAAGHVPYTPLPGEHGNVGIAAHRDTFFRNLRGVREGDAIRLTTTWGTFDYVVDSLKIVRPENIEVLNPTSDPSITLVTCYPFNYVGSAPKRFIVRARQISPSIKPPVDRAAMNPKAVVPRQGS